MRGYFGLQIPLQKSKPFDGQNVPAHRSKYTKIVKQMQGFWGKIFAAVWGDKIVLFIIQFFIFGWVDVLILFAAFLESAQMEYPVLGESLYTPCFACKTVPLKMGTRRR